MYADPPRPLDTSRWTKIGGQEGSNPGGIYKDERGGRWYVKIPRTDDHARNEVLANRLYVLAGARVAPVELAAHEGRLAVASAIVRGITLAELPSHRSVGAGEHFAADAWLANRDVLGADMDNMIVAGGEVIRLDQGGALKYRAQGAVKTDFGPSVEEFDTLRDPRRNGGAASIFGAMTGQELLASIGRVTRIDAAAIRETVQAVYGDSDAAANLAEMLIARRDDLAARARHLAGPD